MSSGAIDQRMRDVAQLRKLGLEIKSARRIGKVAELERAGQPQKA